MKKKDSSPKSTNLPRRLREDLYQADTLITEGKPEQALKILHELEDKFPRQSDILGLMVNAYHVSPLCKVTTYAFGSVISSSE